MDGGATTGGYWEIGSWVTDTHNHNDEQRASTREDGALNEKLIGISAWKPAEAAGTAL
jgi:hypothetical protein